MKILRRHRGFTTNSSSASEWADIQKDMQENPEKYGLPPRTDAGPAEAQEPSQQQVPDTRPAQSFEQESLLRDNLLIIGGILLALCGVFVLERWLRRWLARRRDDDV